jgi:signal transduction histidine kinase/CheY-like chemotaxis protein
MPTNETILIIDDQRDSVNDLIEHILKPAGYTALVARDGQEGLSKALTQEPDLIIMDLNTSRLSGLQVLQELARVHRDIPVVLTTFHGSEEAAVKAFQMGVKAYLIKPYRTEQMQQAIEHGLAEGRLRRERDKLAGSMAQVNRLMERRLKELNVLSSIGKTVTALLDEDRVLIRVVEAAVYITGAEEGFLLLVDQESGELYMRAARGLGEKYAREFRLKVNDSLAGQVVQTGKPIMITGARQSDRFKVKTGYLVRSLLHVPLKVGDSVIGVLSVDHMFEDRTFTDHDLYLLATLADYAAIALENSRLHKQLQKQIEARPAPVESTAAVVPEISAERLAELQARRQEIQGRIQAGRAMFSNWGEQLSAFDVWLDELESGIQSIEPGTEGPPAVVTVAAVPVDVQATLDSIVDGVLEVDPHRRIVRANRVAKEMLGRDLVGRMVDDACDDPRWGKTYRIIEAAAQLKPETPGSALENATTPLLIEQRTLRASFRIKPAANSAFTGIIVVLHDITAEREAQRVKDTFIASVSQELRTPMTSIIGYSDLLLTQSVGPLGETQAKFMNRIRNNAERIEGLLNNLVGMTMIDSRQLEIKAEIMHLGTVIHEAVATLQEQLDQKQQTIAMDIDANLPYVQAGPDAIYHVIRSLVQNASRCSREGVRLGLSARAMQDNQDLYALVSVTDAGGGIAPEDQKKVFNRFYRSDSPAVPGLGDPGISLPIVKVLVEAQGGRVWIDTEPGVGSTLAFVLPTRAGTQPAPSPVALARSNP